MTPEGLYDLFLENLKKFLYPQEWVTLDLSFSKSELLTLLLVEKEGQVIMSQISEYVNSSMSTATGIVERLVQRGYLVRERSEADRRIVLVTLTEQGKAFVAELKRLAFSYIRAALGALTAAEQKSLLNIVTKIVGALKNVGSEAEGSGAVENRIKKIMIE